MTSNAVPTPIAGLTAVVPAGGAGTRLWPLSTADHPKFLLDLTGAGRTLLQQTSTGSCRSSAPRASTWSPAPCTATRSPASCPT